MSLRLSETGVPDCPWSADALDAAGGQVGNGMGDNPAEALEVLIWNVFGFDPCSGDATETRVNP